MIESFEVVVAKRCPHAVGFAAGWLLLVGRCSLAAGWFVVAAAAGLAAARAAGCWLIAAGAAAAGAAAGCCCLLIAAGAAACCCLRPGLQGLLICCLSLFSLPPYDYSMQCRKHVLSLEGLLGETRCLMRKPVMQGLCRDLVVVPLG